MNVNSKLAEPLALSGWRLFIASVTVRRVIIAQALGLLAATALNPIFRTPFLVLWGRTSFISAVILLAFCASATLPTRLPKALPRWVLQLISVSVAAPLSTLVVYMWPFGRNPGSLTALFGSEPHLMGFIWIASVGLVWGPMLAMASLYRERDAQARSAELAFALEKSNLERQALDAKLNVLKAQIEPHFLFNTLANVQALVETGSPQAAPVLRSLIAYLRAAMPRLQERNEATLADELELVQAYLQLMHMRMPDRLTYEILVSKEMRALRFCPMALLTLVENAVRHGIDPSECGGRIEVGAALVADSLHIWVQDSGVGMSEPGGTGTGLQNLRERLKARYGDKARLEFSEPAPHGLRVQIVLPTKEGGTL